MYAYKTLLTDEKDILKNKGIDIKEGKKAKGVKKSVVDNNIKFENYKRALLSNNVVGEEFKL